MPKDELVPYKFEHKRQVGHKRLFAELTDERFLKTLSAETIHSTIKAIFNALVPAELRVYSVESPRSSVNFRNESPEDLAYAIRCLVKEISKRPERSCLHDLELNHMMQVCRRYQNLQLSTPKPNLPHQQTRQIK